MSSRSPKYLLWDILESATTILRLTEALTENTFPLAEAVYLGSRHELMRIGEAASQLPLEFRQAHPHIPWRQLIVRRNFLAHNYPAVNARRVWRDIRRTIPPLIEAIGPLYESLLEEEH